MNVAVLGASAKAERYSNMAVKALLENNHTVFPVHPSLEAIDDLKVYPTLDDIPEKLDTITLYLSAKNQAPVIDSILASKPRRVIFNPGTENPELVKSLEEIGSEPLEACTLVMLKTGTF